MKKFIFVTLLTLTSYILLGGVGLTNLLNFIDVPSIFFIMFYVTIMLLFSGYFKDFINAFRAISGNSYPMEKIKRSIEALNIAIIVTLISGVLGTVNGAVIVLSNTAFAEKILPSLAVSLLTLHYSLLISMLLYPIKSMLKGQLISNE